MTPHSLATDNTAPHRHCPAKGRATRSAPAGRQTRDDQIYDVGNWLTPQRCRLADFARADTYPCESHSPDRADLGGRFDRSARPDGGQSHRGEDRRAGRGGKTAPGLLAATSAWTRSRKLRPTATRSASPIPGVTHHHGHAHKSMPFDARKDLTPIGPVGEAPQLLIVNADLPAKSLQEVIALRQSGAGRRLTTARPTSAPRCISPAT